MLFDENGNEIARCKSCFKLFKIEEMTNRICEECFKEYSENIDVLYKVGKYDKKKEIQLNSFLHSVFTVEEIEEILIEKIKECEKIKHKLDFSEFVNQDEFWFAEKVVEVLKNEK